MPSFVLQTPSLQHLAAIKTVAVLWNHPDILKLIIELSGSLEEVLNKWKVVRDTVDTNASLLELTKPCKQLVLNFIKPMGTAIFAWCHYQNTDENDEVMFLKCKLPETFCWTMHGVIDYAKTAELMVKDVRLDVESRYEMACLNSLEDEARALFPLVAEDRRWEYMNRAIDVSRKGRHDMLVYFTCTLSDDVNQLNVCFNQQALSRGMSINIYLFIRSLFSSNRNACDYFFNRLNPGEKECVLGISASAVFSSSAKGPSFHLLLYYLSLMNEEQQEGLFRECTGDVLVCLLSWPMQSLIVEVAEGGRRYMVYNDYEKMLKAIASKISDGGQDYDYSQLFWKCWLFTPADVQQLLLDNVGFLDKLLETNQNEIVYLVWTEAPAHQLLPLFNRNDILRNTLMDESVSDAALMECKEKAALISSKDKQDKQIRMRSECVSRFVDIAMEDRIKRRRL